MDKQIRQTLLKGSRGFTIVETLIVLAVSGILLLSVFSLINGKQHSTQFQTSINDLRSQMQQISNQVVNGDFPDQTFGCKQGSIGGLGLSQAPQLSANKNNSVGGQCIYIGKAIHFCQASACSGNNDQYAVYSMVALRNDTTTYTPNGVSPYLVAQTGNPTYDATLTDYAGNITNVGNLENGLSVKKMTYQDNSHSGTTGSFAFVQSLNGDLSGGGLGSGQSAKLMVFLPTNPASTITNSVNAEAASLDASLTHYNALVSSSMTVTVCLLSGTTKQYVTMTISSKSSQLDISTKISDVACG